MRATFTGSLEQLGHDLRIGLSVEPHVVQRRAVSHFFAEGSDYGPTTGTSGQEEGSVDVEQDELGSHHGEV
jgi:hypothetical protein